MKGAAWGILFVALLLVGIYVWSLRVEACQELLPDRTIFQCWLMTGR